LFMFAIMKTFITVISASTGRNDFYIWYMALAWWLVLCLPFPGLPHIYFLFTVWLTNEWVGVFLARRSVQHLVLVTSVSVKVKKVMRAEFTYGGNEWKKNMKTAIFTFWWSYDRHVTQTKSRNRIIGA
jgi:hypothetical protein